jgi:hypothetical protein
MLDSKDRKFLFVKPYATQHKAVAFKGFYGVYAHAPQKLFNFMVPGGHKVNKALVAYFGV